MSGEVLKSWSSAAGDFQLFTFRDYLPLIRSLTIVPLDYGVWNAEKEVQGQVRRAKKITKEITATAAASSSEEATKLQS